MPCLSPDRHEAYHGKTIDFEKYSPCHRTTVAHFLNKGKWDDAKLENILKSTVIQFIYKEAQRSGKPVFCIVDDTISSKTKPSSRALHPIEDAYFHQSHLKGKQDYGHQAVAVMLSCNGIVLNYAIVMYDKSKSKVKIVQEIADELPVPPVVSYFLCDSWYTCGGRCFYQKGLLYHWRTEDEPGAVPLRHKAEGRRVRPSYTEDRCRCQPRDRWQPELLYLSV